MSSKKITNLQVSLQSGTDTTLFATWDISDANSYVASYSYEWQYFVDSTWFAGSSGTIPIYPRSITYSAPSNALKARVRVIPNPKYYLKDKKETARFTGTWSAYTVYTFKAGVDLTPVTPPVPDVSIDKYTLTAKVDVYDEKGNTLFVDFELVVNGGEVIYTKDSTFATGRAYLITNRASYQFSVLAGNTYRVRARGGNNTVLGEWSQYSADEEGVTLPGRIFYTPVARATSSTSIEITWSGASAAKSYVIEYTSNVLYFDASPQNVSSVTIDAGTRAEITGLDSGETWFFRIKAVNEQGESEWSAITSALLGKIPNPPTTWSSTTTVITNRDVYLYWVHNSEDGSREKNAQIELTVNGVIQPIITIPNNTGEDDDTATHQYLLQTSNYPAGAKIKWRVRTQGVLPTYSDWSTQRLVEIFAPPTINFLLGNQNQWYWDPFNFETGNIYTSEGERTPFTDNVVDQLPIYVDITSGPTSQIPVGYTISIKANESYVEVDDIGRQVYVIAGQEIFNRYYNVDQYQWVVWLGPEDVSFENGMSYTITCTVAMDSGLTASSSQIFTIDWADDEFDLDAEVSFDDEGIVAYIRPYSDAADGTGTPGVVLSVYRRQFDGGFVPVATGLSNILRPTVTDPHPTLNYARYRIIGQSRYTGQVVYYDMPGIPMAETAIILQWNEEWTSYDNTNPDEMVEKPWTGSILRLPFNVDVDESNDKDVELIEYIGRPHPVSYFGTQIGQKATWRAAFDKEDEETIYALRRLAIWMGNVYVREPSGSGYWATVNVNFGQEHLRLDVPVTLGITRVEGGL